jgi:hypothetical protein
MKQNVLKLDVAMKNKGRSSRIIFSTGSQIRAHSLGVLKLVTAARIAVYQEVESLLNTRSSRPSLNDDPSLCATLYTAGGVVELYQRRSTRF